jgi:hypothetical protein
MLAENRKEIFIKYLLGTASESERDDVELSFVDDSTFDDFLATEDAMIKEYLRRELPPHDRSLFEENYLKDSPENVRKVFVATAVLDVFNTPTLTRPTSDPVMPALTGWWQNLRSYLGAYGITAIASATSVLIVGLIFGYQYLAALRHEAESLRTENDRLNKTLQEERTRSGEELAETRRRLDKANEQLKNTRPSENRSGEAGGGHDAGAGQDETQPTLAGGTRREPITSPPSPRTGENAHNKDIYAQATGDTLSPQGASKGSETITGEVRKVRIHLLIRPKMAAGPYKVKLRLAGGGERDLEGLPATGTNRGKAVIIELRPEDLAEGNNVFYIYSREPDGSYSKEADDGYVIRVEKR